MEKIKDIIIYTFATILTISLNAFFIWNAVMLYRGEGNVRECARVAFTCADIVVLILIDLVILYGILIIIEDKRRDYVGSKK